MHVAPRAAASLAEADTLIEKAVGVPPADAEAVLRRVLKRLPAEVPARLLLARTLEARGDLEDAAAEHRLALVASLLDRPTLAAATDAEALAELVVGLADAGHGDQARAAAEALPRHPGALVALARLSGDETAEPLLRRALALAPADRVALAAFTDLLGRTERVRFAVAWAERAGDPLRLAQLQQRRGLLEAAEASYRRVLAQDPADADAVHGLVTVLRRQGRPAAALETAERRVAQALDDARALADLGKVLAALDRPEPAAVALAAALAREPYLPGLPRLLGAQYRKLGRPTDAATADELAAAAAPRDTKLMVLVGSQWEAAGRPERAVPWYRRAAALDPKHAARLRRALAARRSPIVAAPMDDAVHDDLCRLPLAGPLDCRPMTGGDHNLMHRITVDGGDYVMRHSKFPPERWDRYLEEGHNAAAGQARGIGYEVLTLDAGDGLMLSRFVDGRVLDSAALRDPAMAARAGALYRRLHQGPRFVGAYDIHRIIDRIERRIGHAVPPAEFADYRELRGHIDPLRRSLRAHPMPSVPGHNDPVAENLIDAGDRLVLIDWQCSGMADPHWEIGALSAQARMEADGEAALLDAYLGSGDPAARLRVASYRTVCAYFWFAKHLSRGLADPAAEGWEKGARRWQRRLRRAVEADDFPTLVARAARLV